MINFQKTICQYYNQPPVQLILTFDYINQIHLIPLSGAYCTKHYANYLYKTRVRTPVPTNVAGNTTWAAPSRSGRWKRSLDFRTGESTRPCIVHAMKGWLLTNIDAHGGEGVPHVLPDFLQKKKAKKQQNSAPPPPQIFSQLQVSP